MQPGKIVWLSMENLGQKRNVDIPVLHWQLLAISKRAFLHVMQLQYAAKRGFYLVAPKPGAKLKNDRVGEALPGVFIQLEAGRGRATVSCTTHELNALIARLKDATDDCMVLTEQVAHTSLAASPWIVIHPCHVASCLQGFT